MKVQSEASGLVRRRPERYVRRAGGAHAARRAGGGRHVHVHARRPLARAALLRGDCRAQVSSERRGSGRIVIIMCISRGGCLVYSHVSRP